MHVINRAGPRSVALETTLLVHGIPRQEAPALNAELGSICSSEGASPALVGIVGGQPTVGMTDEELARMLAAPTVPKANTANLGVLVHHASHAATTVSATMELAAAAAVRVFATGGLGGVHRGYAQHLDISSDLAAFTRFPVAVVTSGCKSILDVEATREALETLGVTVVGFRTERFPAFYLRESKAGIDARFDDEAELAKFIAFELARTGRGIVIANPIPPDAELNIADWSSWLENAQSEARASGAAGRDATPVLLGALHRLSGGATLRANLALVRSNVRLAARLAAKIPAV